MPASRGEIRVKEAKAAGRGAERRVRARQIRLVIEYDGSGFSGWQTQAKAEDGGRGRSVRSVQGALEEALRRVTGEELTIVGAGRTDAGVHALGQVACFRTESTVPSENFAAALTAELPRDVSVLSSEEVAPGFHPRRNVRRKLYRYTILNRPVRAALGRERVAHVATPLDVEGMREAARFVVGVHDFTSFAAAEATRGRNPVREITRLEVGREGDVVTIDCEGPGFLMHQVRTIAGSLVEVGRGKRPPEWIREVLEARDRSRAGPTASAGGLTLVRVEYAE